MTRSVQERALAVLAQRYRKTAGKSSADAARDMKVSQVSIFNAEENPAQSLTKLRIRLIERYSPYKVIGPVYLLKRK
jgi:hypothetical protein